MISKSFAKKLVLLMCFGAIGILNCLFIMWTSGFEKLLGMMFFFTILIPALLQVLAFIFTPIKAKSKKSFVPVSDYKAEVERIERFKESIKPKFKKSKGNSSQYYSEVRECIIATSKAGLFDRESVLKLKSELDYLLQDKKDHYSNFTFDNDMHEIYIKLKNKHLQDEDYLYLKEILQQIADEREDEDDEIQIV